jgi:hypothetical protein
MARGTTAGAGAMSDPGNQPGGLAGIQSVANTEGQQSPTDTVNSCSDKKQAEAPQCPPHDWVIDEGRPGVSADDGIAHAQDNAKALETKPSKADQRRGYVFEARAIEANKQRKPISFTGRTYICRRCGKEQEIDIGFEDGQIAECSSKKAKQVDTGKKEQAKKEKEIQAMLNKDQKPLAKIDGRGEMGSEAQGAKEVFERRNYNTEILS